MRPLTLIGAFLTTLALTTTARSAALDLYEMPAPSERPVTSSPEWTRWSTGPRLGMVVTSGDTAAYLEQVYGVGSAMSVFGWQGELQSEPDIDGFASVLDVVVFAAGLEHGFEDVSVSFMFGARSRGGYEFLVGHYYSEAHMGLTVAVGKTFTVGNMQMPVHIAVTDTLHGTKTSLTAGWNL